jgi:hypothetical protein
LIAEETGKAVVHFGVNLVVHRSNIWGHPLAVSGQLVKRAPDASHHLILMAVT